jgi:hypothetical protein
MTIASEITRLQGAKADIKTAIENKGVTVSSADTIDQYAGYIDQIETGTTIVNGVIKNYLASTSTVDAGTFVEFVNEFGTKTQLSTKQLTSPITYTGISATALDDNRVFIAFGEGGNYYLAAVVATVSGNTITPGTAVRLSSVTNTGYDNDWAYSRNLSAAALDDSTVIIAHGTNSSGQSYLRLELCTVSGDVITLTTSDYSVRGTDYAGNCVSAIKLDSSRVFIVFNNKSWYQYQAIVCTISGSTITAGTAVEGIGGTSGTSKDDILAILIDQDKVLVPFRTSAGYPSAMICTVSGSSITVGTSVLVKSTSYQYMVAGIAGSNKAIMCYASPNSEYTTRAASLGVSGNTITVLSEQVIDKAYSDNSSATLKPLCALSKNGGIIVYAQEGSAAIYRLSIRLAEDKPYIQSMVYLNAGKTIATQLTNDKELAINPSASGTIYLNGEVCGTKIQASTGTIDGFTKTEATTSVPGEVWVLNS